jgi:hypothetical protein
LGELIQRRGTHVNSPEIGSRGDAFCIGGIYEIHADLRREFFWGNFIWVIFWVLFVEPRGVVRRGDQQCDFWGNYGL